MPTKPELVSMMDHLDDHSASQLPYSSPSPPPSYSESQHPLLSLPLPDPRSSSTQSLTPERTSSKDDRRKLLLVYIHGFMGAENSFRSFPAHVHNLLTITMSESHVVHSKIYPRYQSRRPIQFATEEFSKWLAPHESPFTDTILLGHSMGGLLAAEVALLPPYSPSVGQALRHHILGTVNFDVPFLGMHPGVIKSGLGSIFNPAPPPQDRPTAGMSPDMSPQQSPTRASSSALSLDASSSIVTNPLGSPEPVDPNFNPIFENDVLRPVRKGWENMFHFARKHRDDFVKATKQLVTSHLEFGGAVADLRGLQARYARIRALEEEDEKSRKNALHSTSAPPRVRFVNYYTASTGRPKKAKPPTDEQKEEYEKTPANEQNEEHEAPLELKTEISDLNLSTSPLSSPSPTPHSSIEKVERSLDKSEMDNDIDGSNEAETTSSTAEEDKNEGQNPANTDSTTTCDSLSSFQYLPEIPLMPEEPAPLNLPPDLDKNARKYAEQGHRAAVKAYKEAIKSRSKIIKERERIEAKHAKQVCKQQEAKNKAARREQEKRTKEEEAVYGEQEKQIEQKKARTKEQAESSQESVTESLLRVDEPTSFGEPTDDSLVISTENLTPTPSSFSLPTQHVSLSSDGASSSPLTSSKPKHDRKFCILPSKAPSGKRDPAWVRVPMQDVDEVGAHCGLFFLGETYERLVGDVAARVEDWWREAEGERVAREFGDE